eukprot:5549977-Amphidinium_carterae.1
MDMWACMYGSYLMLNRTHFPYQPVSRLLAQYSDSAICSEMSSSRTADVRTVCLTLAQSSPLRNATVNFGWLQAFLAGKSLVWLHSEPSVVCHLETPSARPCFPYLIVFALSLALDSCIWAMCSHFTALVA